MHLHRNSVKIDLLFITGDIAYHGYKNEYKFAEDFLEQLITKIANPSLKVFIVPGNHDVNRKYIEKTMDTLQLKNPEDWNAILEMEWKGQSKRIANRFQNYLQFLGNIGKNLHLKISIPCDKKDFFYVSKFNHYDFVINILGLNSAWACQGDGDKKRISLGEFQVFEACKSINKEKINEDITIALIHHPLDWFNMQDKGTFEILARNKVIIFRGHSHIGKASVCGQDGERIHELGVSAGYLKNPRKNEIGFQFVSIDPIEGKYFIQPFLWKKNRFLMPSERSRQLSNNGFISESFRDPIHKLENVLNKPIRSSRNYYAPKPIEYFFGRKKYLKMIEKHMLHPGEKRIISIFGKPGVGKTELAKKYAWDYADRYADGVFWVSYEAPKGENIRIEDAISQLLSYMPKRQAIVPLTRDESIRQILRIVEGKNTLLVLDNVNNPSQLIPSRNHSLIITTNNQRLAKNVAGRNATELHEFTDNESLNFLESRLGKERVERDTKDAIRIIERCGNMPQALDIICSIINRNDEKTMSDFLSELTDGLIIKKLKIIPYLDDREDNIFRTFYLSIHNIEETHEKHKEVITLFKATSACSPKGFRLESIAKAAGIEKNSAGEHATYLTKISLLEKIREKGKNIYFLHPLIREFATYLVPERKPPSLTFASGRRAKL